MASLRPRIRAKANRCKQVEEASQLRLEADRYPQLKEDCVLCCRHIRMADNPLQTAEKLTTHCATQSHDIQDELLGFHMNGSRTFSIFTQTLTFPKMDWTFLPVTLLLIEVAEANGQQFFMNPVPRLLLDTITYYDMFGDDVGMAYYKGYVQVECEIGPSLYVCTFDRVHLIDPDGDVVWSARCKDRVTLRLDINENTTFGEYKCQYKDESSSEVLPYDYRFCAPEASKAELQSCKNDCTLSGDFGNCIVTANGIAPCRNIEKYWCLVNETGVTYCTISSSTGESSLCKSMSRYTYDKVQSRVKGVKFCFNDIDATWKREAGINWYHKSDYKSRPVPYNGRFLVITKWRTPDVHDKYEKVPPDKYEYSHVEVQCPGCYDVHCKENLMTATCVIVNMDGEIIEQRVFSECSTFANAKYIFNHSVFKDDQFGYYKFKCVFDNGTAVVASTQNYIVDFGVGNASIHKTNKSTGNPEDDQYTKLECRLNTYPPFPFEIEWRWFDNISSSGAEEMTRISSANASILSVRRPAKYWCEAAVQYETCTRRGFLVIHSEATFTSENITLETWSSVKVDPYRSSCIPPVSRFWFIPWFLAGRFQDY